MEYFNNRSEQHQQLRQEWIDVKSFSSAHVFLNEQEKKYLACYLPEGGAAVDYLQMSPGILLHHDSTKK